jgi:hypothetical protein
LERIWEDLPTSTKAPEWKDFWKSLDDWAHNNINQGARPKVEWNRLQVAAWARKVSNFSEKSAKILIEQELNGKRLLVYGSKDEACLLSDFDGAIPKPALRELWAEIEKLKKSLAEPGKRRILSNNKYKTP